MMATKSLILQVTEFEPPPIDLIINFTNNIYFYRCWILLLVSLGNEFYFGDYNLIMRKMKLFEVKKRFLKQMTCPAVKPKGPEGIWTSDI